MTRSLRRGLVALTFLTLPATPDAARAIGRDQPLTAGQSASARGFLRGAAFGPVIDVAMPSSNWPSDHPPIAGARLDTADLGSDSDAESYQPAPGLLARDPLLAAIRDAKDALSNADGDSRVDAGAGAERLSPFKAEVSARTATTDQVGRGLGGVWDAFSYTGWLPASPQVAAGPEHVMATVNSRVRVFDKGGIMLNSSSLRKWFQPVLVGLTGPELFVTEPWVVYDLTENRYVLSAIAYRGGLSLMLLAVSDDADPIGTWCVFGSDASLNGVTPTLTYASNGRLGSNADAVVFTANMAALDTRLFAYSKARVFPRSVLFDKACPTLQNWVDVHSLQNEDSSRVWDLRPVVGETTDPDLYLINGRLDEGDSLSLFKLRTESGPEPLGNPPRAPSGYTIPVQPFSIAPDAEQPDTNRLVSTGSASLHSAVQRGRRLWTTHTVACSWPGDGTLRACSRWYSLNVDSNAVDQSGTFGQPGAYLFDPEIMPDRDEHAVVAFNRASRVVPIEAAYVCRYSFAPPGAIDRALIGVVEGQGCYERLGGTDYNRWGFHNGISLDPATGRTWIHLAYAYGSSDECSANAWRTALADVSCAPMSGPTATAPGRPLPTALPTVQMVEPGSSAPSPRPPLAVACSTAIDAMLVLDSSGSIGIQGYEIVRAFSRAFIASLGVGTGGARVGIVQFSSPDANRLESGLTDDIGALDSVVENMTWLSGSTDMDGGLQMGLDELRANGRAGVPKLIVMLSDGQPNQGDPMPVATEAKSEGIRLLTMGVGYGVDADLMRAMASSPGAANFLFAEEFDDLMELLDTLVVNVCPAAAPTPFPTATARVTHRVFLPLVIAERCPPDELFVDVALVIDASTSMAAISEDGRPKYEVALEAARGFADGLRLHPGGDQLAVVAFNDQARLLQELTSDASRTDAVLRTFTPIRAQSRLEAGVRLAASELLGPRHRTGVPGALVVLTDGNTNPEHGDQSIVEAWHAKNAGLTVFVVGIGPDLSVATLEPMASGSWRFFPSAQDALLAPIFRDLVKSVTCLPRNLWPGHHSSHVSRGAQ